MKSTVHSRTPDLKVVVLLLVSTLVLFSCTSKTYRKSGDSLREERRETLLTNIHMARMNEDLTALRKSCRDFIGEFPEDPESRKAMYYLVEADIGLKLYSEAESFIDSLLPASKGDELATLRVLGSRVKESRGNYTAACSELLKALEVAGSSGIRGEATDRLKRLAPLISDDDRRRLINEFRDADGVFILVDESLRFAEEIGDTASVRILGDVLTKLGKREQTGTPFGSRKVIIPERESKGEARPFSIGVLCPLSGRLSPIGHEFIKGASIALKEAVLVKHSNMELVVTDTKGDPLVAMKEAKRLIEKEGVRVIVGAVLSSTTTAAAIVAQEQGVVFVSPVATAEGIGDIGDMVFQLESTTEAEVIAIADAAVKTLKLRRIAVLSVSDERAFRIVRLFRAEVERLGGEIVITRFYEEGRTDFKDCIEDIRSSAPEALFIPSDTEDLILILPQLSFYEFGVRLLGLSNWNSDRLIKMVSRDMEGAVFPANFLDDYLEQSIRASAAVLNEPIDDINPFLLGGYRGVKVVADVVGNSSMDERTFYPALKSYLNNRENLFLTISRNKGIPIYTVLNGRRVVFTELKTD